jgi:hypothetical protein
MNIVKTNTPRGNYTNIVYKEQFVSKQNEYQQLFSRITGAFLQIEYLSVVEGTRDSHLMFILPHELEFQRSRFKKYGLEIVLLNKEIYDTHGGYGNHSGDWEGNGDYTWRAIVTRPENVQRWNDIWRIRTADVFLGEYLIGRALGYPDCCSKFFTQIWMRDAGLDTTWQQALNTVHKVEQTDAELWKFPKTNITNIELPETTPIWGNNLLRWAGMKLVTHLPCSFDCKETKRIALENLGIATKYGFGNEYNKLCQIQEWDVTWSTQYGIATIETPVFTIQTVSDITTEKYIVHKKGHNNIII